MLFFKFIKSKTFLWQLALGFCAIVVMLVAVTCSLSWYTQHNQTIEVPDFRGLTEEQVKPSIGSFGLEYVVIDSIYSPERTPGVIVEQIPGAGKQVKEGRKIFFTINAFSREMVVMPKLVDYSRRNAEVVIESKGFKLGQVIYRPSAFIDLVLDQLVDGKSVAPGTKLPKGTMVQLVVGSNREGGSSVVPDVVGMSRIDALKEIDAVGLMAGSMIYDETVKGSTDSLTAVVYKQTPEANSQEGMGAQVNLWFTMDMEKIVSALAAQTPDE